jgi:hypothetical protein
VLSPQPLRPRHANIHVPVVALALAAAASAWLAPGRASAAELAADLEYDLPTTNGDLDSALGFAVRLGWQLHLPALVLTPEVGYHHAAFGDDVTLNRGFVGARVAIGEIFRVGAYGHVGVGNAAYHIPGPDEEVTDATYDIGGFLDFTLLPLLNIGVHAGYGHLKGSDGIDALGWVPIGVHAELVF